jgi:hypothetical protein
MSSQFNDFYSPETAEDVPGLSIDTSILGRVLATFGEVPPCQEFWFSGLAHNVDIFNYPDFTQKTILVCADGTTDSNSFGYYLVYRQ